MRLLLILLVLVWSAAVHAQSPTKLCIPTTKGGCQVIDPNNPLPVTPSGTQGVSVNQVGGSNIGLSNPVPVAEVGYPLGSTPITGNATGTTGAVVGTLAGVTGKTTYICGFDVSAIGGTAAVGPITVAGTITSSLKYQLASSAGGITLSRTFTPCIPASATNTAITITTTADGTATAVSVNSSGYQQ